MLFVFLGILLFGRMEEFSVWVNLTNYLYGMTGTAGHPPFWCSAVIVRAGIVCFFGVSGKPAACIFIGDAAELQGQCGD